MDHMTEPCMISWIAVIKNFPGASLSKARKEGVSHLYFNACLTLSTRYFKLILLMLILNGLS